jgi:membrane-associated phospholipid phosphatase
MSHAGGVGLDRAVSQGGFLCLLAFLALTVIVTQHRFDRADQAAHGIVHQTRHPAITGFMEQASFFGGQPGQVVVLVVAVGALWARRRRWALALPLVMAGVGIVQFLAKWAVDRPRPNLAPWGFPSAHVLSLVVLCGYLTYVVCLDRARPAWGRAGLAACAAVVGTVAYSRMYLEAHFLSDVLGGFTAGLAYLSLTIRAIRATPALDQVVSWWPLGRGTEPMFVPATAGLAVEPLADPVAAVSMTPSTSVVDAA